MVDTWVAIEAENPSLAEARSKESLAWVGVHGTASWPDDDEIGRSGDCRNPVPRRLSDGRVIGGLYVPPTCTIILTEGDAQRRWEMPAGWTTKQIHVAPSGKVALVGAQYDGRGIFAELDLTSGALAIVDAGFVEGLDKSDVAQIWDMEYVGDDDHLAALVAAERTGTWRSM